jgi:hypothetical protein
MTLPIFRLVSPNTQANAPFTFGHVFKQGDVASGFYVDSDLTDWQATPTTYWPDGSVRHAIIAGRTDLTANVLRSIALSASGTNRSGAALTEADLASALPATTLVCGAETITLGGLVGTAALQRTVCTGPVMSNWLYRKQLSGSNHLVAWFDVRLYKGGVVEIFPWIENGYLLVASPTNDVRTYTFTIGVTQKFSQSLDIKHHTRVPLITGTAHSYWTTDPQIAPKHDTAYMMVSKMVPHYGFAPSEAALSNTGEYPTTYTPNWLGTTRAFMSDTGYGNFIGILPNWSAGYCASGGDERAYKATIVNGMASGSWHVHYRDETHGHEPLKFTDFPDISDNWGGTPTVPASTGGVNQKDGINALPDRSHQPSLGFLPWLLTGRWYFLEEHLFWVTWNYLQSNYVTREGAKAIYFDDQIRSRGWALRSHAQALAIIPDTHPCYLSLKSSWEYNTDAYEARHITGTRDSGAWVNNLGWLGSYSGYPNHTSAYFDGTSSGYWWDSNWMQATLALAFGTAWDFDLPQSSASKNSHAAVRNFAYKVPIGLAGDGTAGTYSYRRFATFEMPIGTDDFESPPDTWLANYGAVFAVKESNGLDGASALNALPAGTNIYYNNSPATVDMWASHSATAFCLSALVYAVSHGATGADAAYARITGAPNYGTSEFANISLWAVAPRSAEAPTGVSLTGSNSTQSATSGAGAITISSMTPGPSVRVDINPPFDGAVAIGARGLGILGSNIASSGTHGPAPLYVSLDPGDDNNEYQMLITSVPAGLHLEVSEFDDSVRIWADTDGTFVVPFDVVQNGNSIGSESMTLMFGSVLVSSDLEASYLTNAFVSVDLANTYVINAAVNADLAATYSLSASVNADMAVAFAIHSRVAADLSASYVTNAVVSADLSASYATNAGVSADLSAAYTIYKTVGADLSATFSIENIVAVSVDLVASYDIESPITTVGANLDASYTVQEFVNSSLAASYQMAAVVQADLAALYQVNTPVFADLETSYAIHASVSANLAPAYSIDAVVQADLAETFQINAYVQSDLAPAYRIDQHVGATLEVSYTVYGLVRNSLSAVFAIESVRTARRALVLSGTTLDEIADEQLATGLRPIVLLNGRLRLRSASEGVPVVFVNGRMRLLQDDEVLEI